jgi:hypothetical protein
MNKNVQHILGEIAGLEEELATVIHEQQEQLQSAENTSRTENRCVFLAAQKRNA